MRIWLKVAAVAATTSRLRTIELMPVAKSWIEVSHAALASNLRALRRAAMAGLAASAPETAVLAVIKADAYGHGATLCAPVLARAGAEWLGVTDAAEGAAVRESLDAAGLDQAAQPQILLMCGLEAAEVPLLVEHRLTPVVWFAEQLGWLAAHADLEQPLPVHLEIDTGMARQGVRPGDDLGRLLAELRGYPQLRLDGVLTHFASAEIAWSPQTEVQQRRFERAVMQIRESGVRPAWMHAGNTSTLDEGLRVPWLRAQAEVLGARLLARSGLALFGHALALEGAEAQLAPSLRPAGTWKSHVIAVSDLLPGETIGYNGTYTVAEGMRVALLPVGYADGLRRELSSTNAQAGGWVMLGGRRAPIVGRISMNLVTVDVTKLADVRVGDEVVLLGAGITAVDHAELARTIPYEILCGLRARSVLTP